MPTLKERFQGGLLGLACGDALGTTLEFQFRGSFTAITDMVGGGPFNLKPGEWTDDCSMALCLAQSLLECDGFDAADQMKRYCEWESSGYMSSNGICFDIGSTVKRALNKFRRTGDPFSGETGPRTAGNGSIMRLIPIPMYFFNNPEQIIFFAGESSRTTHGAEEAIEASRLFARQLYLALSGADKNTILFESGYQSVAPKIAALAEGGWRSKPENVVYGSGYVVESLEAALWSFWSTDDFASAVLRAANLGGDADTTAAICGQIAGAFYGVDEMPLHWRQKIVMADEITALADRFSSAVLD